MTANLKVLVPEATINYVKNPSFRYDTTGWYDAITDTSILATKRVLTYALYGIASLMVVTSGVPGTRDGAWYRTNDLVGINEPITASAYARGTGSVRIRLHEGSGKDWTSSPVSLRSDRWTRLEISGFSTGTNDVRIYVEEADVSRPTATFYITGVQIERKSYATTYCDGDQPGCRWNITDSSSNSSRNAYTRQGGHWIDLAGPCRENDNIYVTNLGGMGMAPLVNNLQSWSLAPGSYYQNKKILDRVITFSFHIKNVSLRIVGKPDLRKLHELRQQLIDIFKPDMTGGDEPFLLSYQEGDRELFISVRYEAGLEGDWDVRNSWLNSFPIRFLAVDPLFFENNKDSSAVDFQDSRVVYGIIGRVDGNWNWLNGGLFGSIGDGIVKEMAFSPRGILYAVGINGRMNYGIVSEAANQVVYWDGSRWQNLFPVAANDYINSIAVAPNGDIYVTGNFTTINGVAANRIAKWNGTVWSALGTGLNALGYVVRVAPNGDVYAGGNFTTAGGVPCYYVARWDGGSWNSMGPFSGLNSYVYSMAISKDGSVVYVGGAFTDQNTLAANALLRIASYSPTLNTFSAMGSGFNNSVFRIIISPAGIIYSAGAYTLSGASSANYVSKWNGSAWESLGVGVNSIVRAIAVSPTGELLVGGEFTTAGGLTMRLLATWNGSAWVNPDVYLSTRAGWITDIQFSPSGDLYVAGSYFGYISDPPTWMDDPYITYYPGITYVINEGTAENSPIIYLYGSGKLRWIENQTTHKRIYFNLDILAGEEVVIDFGKGTIKSTVRGDLSYSLLPGSDFGGFTLLPGSNKIAALMYNDVGALMYMYNRPQHWSADGTVDAGALT